MTFSTLLTEVIRPPSHTRTSTTTGRRPSSEAPITAFQKTIPPPSSLLPPPTDTFQGNLTITYKHNLWHSINSRMPSLRYGKGHIFNNFFDSALDGVNAAEPNSLSRTTPLRALKKPSTPPLVTPLPGVTTLEIARIQPCRALSRQRPTATRSPRHAIQKRT